MDPSPVVELAARFDSASAALVFTGQLSAAAPATLPRFLRGTEGTGWWVAAVAALDVAREIVSAARGQLHVVVGAQLFADRGWGSPPTLDTAAASASTAIDDLSPVDVLDLVRVAGLHPSGGAESGRAVLLLPGYQASGVVRRALDLGLSVTYRPVRLEPLFHEPGSDTDAAGHTLTELRLCADGGTLPASLLAALERDPFVLTCREVGADGAEALLFVQRGFASPMPDHQLAGLVDSDIWVLADVPHGCWRLRATGEPADAAGLVRLAEDYPLAVAAGGWPLPDGLDSGPDHDHDPDSGPEPVTVSVVPARTPGAAVDAILLDDADIACLPLLLEGHPLAEAAVLVAGRDRHLLLAAGGVLDRLPVGEPLHCVGPGPLYLPIGYRTSPRLPPSARLALFGMDARTAVAALPDGAVAFDLPSRRPVWALWAGTPPDIDVQLPAETLRALADVDAELTPVRPAVPPEPPRTGRRRGRELLDRIRSRDPATPERTWREEALEAEFAGELSRAAALHERHGDPLRAAHLYERAAHLYE